MWAPGRGDVLVAPGHPLDEGAGRWHEDELPADLGDESVLGFETGLLLGLVDELPLGDKRPAVGQWVRASRAFAQQVDERSQLDHGHAVLPAILALAVDLVALGIEDAYDVAVLTSADTDLIPAARQVLERSAKRVVCVGLQADPGCQAPQPLDLDHTQASRFFVQRGLFERAAERTDFYDSHNDRHGKIPQDRWVAVQARLGRR